MNQSKNNKEISYKDYVFCEFCDKKYTRGNKWHHDRGKKHKNNKKTILFLKRTLDEFKEKNTLNDRGKKQYITDDGTILYLTNLQYEIYKKGAKIDLKLLK